MSNPRDVNARVGLDPSKYVAGAEKVNWATKQMLRQQETADRKWRAMQGAHQSALDEEARRQAAVARAVAEGEAKKQAAMKATGRVLVTGGAAIAAGLGLATKAAMDWESAWTGVAKTVDGTPEQLDAIETGLRGLARELPATHEEIAGVAAAAGQLGISTGGIVEFTRTMINLGETTNLSAEEAATTLARLANITGTSEGEIDNLGAAIVGLGNNFATTEAEISAMALRLAGAGQQAGMTEGDILGLAAAASSVGIEAEAGGTALSKTMTTIGMEIDNGGDRLATFARVAGMSAEEFSTAWRDDAGSTLAAFITGLADTSAMGQTTNQVLSDLGITGIREADTLRRLSSAQDVLNDALATGNTAFAENTALVEEAAKRYDTAEAKVALAKNAIVDAGIGIGETFLPALAGAAEGVAGVAEAFASLPEPVQRTVGVLGAVASAAGLVGGGFLLIAPKARDALGVFRDLQTSSPRLASGLSKVSRAAGVAAGAFVALQVADSLAKSFQEMPEGVEETTQALLDGGVAGQSMADVFAELNNGTNKFGTTDIDSLTGAINRLVNPRLMDRLNDFGAEGLSFGGAEGASDREAAIAQLDNIGNAMATLVSTGNAERAAEEFDSLAEAWTKAGGNVEDLRDLLPGYTEALAAADTQQQLTGDSASQVADGLGEVDPAAEEAAEALEDFYERATGAFESFIDPGGAFQAAIDKNVEMAEAAADASDDAEDSWEDFYDGTSVSAKDYIAQLREQVEAQENWASNMERLSKRVNNKLPADMRDTANAMIDELMELGPEGAAQVEVLEGMSNKQLEKVVGLYGRKGAAASKGFADNVNSTRPDPIPVDSDTSKARDEVARTKAYMDEQDGVMGVDADTSDARAAVAEFKTWTNLQSAVLNLHSNITRTITERSVTAKHLGKATGGSVVGPGTGTSDSVPAMLSNGEHVWTAKEVDAAGGHGAVEAMRAAVLGQRLAQGGAVGSASRALKRARSRRDATRGQLRGARRAGQEARADRLERELDRRQSEVDDQLARLERLREQRADLRQASRRREVVSQARSGLSGAYSVVDDMLGLADSGDLSGRQESRLEKRARGAEKAMRRLYNQAEKLENRLAKARDRVQELSQIKAGVQSALAGGFSLGSVTGVTNPWTGETAAASKRDYLSSAEGYASKVRTFAARLRSLRDAGFSGVIVQEVASLGVEAGIPAADALLSMGKGQRGRLNDAYADISRFSGQAGGAVAGAFYEGGVAAAKGLTQGLASKQSAIESQITKVAKGMQSALKKALGINSPSRVFRELGQHTGEGMRLGLTDKQAAVTSAAANLLAVPSAVPASVYANPAAGKQNVSVSLDEGSMAKAMDGVAMTLLVDGKPVSAIVRTEIGAAASSAAATMRGGRR
ncbi:phage tail tape measure protein [Isoptericola aurantiacus]|uniref:phage tail tape measure protein n=1 Tax=Isoptericola aurantiacus TaxID=3377839 RepID=UPI00383BEB4D